MSPRQQKQIGSPSLAKSRWRLVREKLLHDIHNNINIDNNEEEEVDEKRVVKDSRMKPTNPDYWKILRDKLTNCTLAPIITSCDVDELEELQRNHEKNMERIFQKF